MFKVYDKEGGLIQVTNTLEAARAAVRLNAGSHIHYTAEALAAINAARTQAKQKRVSTPNELIDLSKDDEEEDIDLPTVATDVAFAVGA